MLRKDRFLAIFTFLFLASLVGLAAEAGASAVPTKKQAKILEATANTPQEHLSLLMYYRDVARRFEEKVRYHEEMAEIYRKNPLPYDGKVAVPMQRHCKDWAFYFGQKAEQATVLATYHQEQAGVTSPTAGAFAQPSRWGLRSSGFSAAANTGSTTIQATGEQSSLFHNSAAASARFYDLTRILTYFVSAKGKPAIGMPELRESATALFDSEQQFLQTLTEPQRTAVGSHLRAIERLRREVENGIDRLANGTQSPSSSSYFKSAQKIKGSIENWHNEQHEIALRLGIRN
jgi:hypothetical protein